MTSRERMLIYSALGLLLAVNGVILFGRLGQPAYAAPNALDDLGPADRLILSGEKELVVRNESGRIAWSDSEHARAYSVGFVHVADVVQKLMQTSQYTEERERLTEEINAEEQEWREKGQALEERYGDVTPEDPEFEEARAAFGEWQANVQQWRQQANERVNNLAMEQLEHAYREVVDAVNIVADERDIDLVLRFTPTADPLATGMSGQTMLDIRLRPVLRYPDGLDITVDVLEEMALAVD